MAISRVIGLYQAVIAWPLGRLGIVMDGEAVSVLDYLSSNHAEQPAVDAATRTVVEQLMAYFRDPCTPLTVAVAPAGTVFQQRVWQALQAIPSGQTLSYGALAQQLATAARPIGGACRRNPVPILIPCHRIVSQQGLGGYTGEVAGDPLAIKRWLLRHEGVELAPSP